MVDSWKIWVDTGGTFTDCFAIDSEGKISTLKVLSNSSLRGKILASDVSNKTIHHLDSDWPVSIDIFQGYLLKTLDGSFTAEIKKYDPVKNIIETDKAADLSQKDFEITANEEVPILAARILTQTPLLQELPDIDLKLGSTKGTNALLERKTARTGLVITRGFKDLLLINTQQRPDLFTLNVVREVPYYDSVIEIDERIDQNGAIRIDLKESDLKRLLAWSKKEKLESVAVALLFGFQNPEHEKRIAEFLTDHGLNYVSVSHRLFNAIKLLPRAETAVVNASLAPIIEFYVQGIRSKLGGNSSFRIMTSAGGLAGADQFHPKDSLLSGPAGGLVGSALSAKRSGEERLLTFDMGGTSTDVARYDSEFDYTFETRVGGSQILSPSLHIETIAAGGGSICQYDGARFTVGPESGGASPGPACYGAGGPLTVTDVNLLLGKINPEDFGIPVHIEDSQKALQSIREQIKKDHQKEYTALEILNGFDQIANEMMAAAIRKISTSKGFSPSEHCLVAFGGAGGQHACQIAELLNISKVIIPNNSGLLSAYGIGNALIEKFVISQILKTWDKKLLIDLKNEFDDLKGKVISELKEEGFEEDQIEIRKQSIYLRFRGQDHTIELDWKDGYNLTKRFMEKYINLYGHWVEHREIEVESIKCMGSNQQSTSDYNEEHSDTDIYHPQPKGIIQPAFKDVSVRVYRRDDLDPGARITGPAILGSKTQTTFIKKGWELSIDNAQNEILKSKHLVNTSNDIDTTELSNLELFINRFTGIADQMGALLQRASFSVNIKERLDFSCGILDRDGFLVVNAPHIPVHLGSLGICGRTVMKNLEFKEGDVAITNHPAFGGSHLPDITLISPVYYQGERVAFVVNRAHHAEIGGKTPGSMPVDATSLEEEGVVFGPQYLVRNGMANWEQVKEELASARYPSRSVEENLADLQGALASIQSGVRGMQELCKKYGGKQVVEYLEKIQEYSSDLMAEYLQDHPLGKKLASENLDDGSKIEVRLEQEKGELRVDFEGTSVVHPGNMNATPAIVSSAVLYVLRVLLNKPVPLNEGLVRNVGVHIPLGSFLNPGFDQEPGKCPAVVGGNTETSQRVVDTLFKALEVAGCSQGTMNNVLFGNEEFGYYETICGGTGAGKGFKGTDGVHQHMTNTRITDPEIIEQRYPVRINRFEIRKGSGGKGKHKGGNGVIREWEFKEPCKLTILAEHRIVKPYGMKKGEAAATGKQYVIKKNNDKIDLQGKDHFDMLPGDRFVVETPGGGGYGERKKEY